MQGARRCRNCRQHAGSCEVQHWGCLSPLGFTHPLSIKCVSPHHPLFFVRVCALIIRSKCISIPCGLQPVTKQPATECLCLSVCPTPRPARNKAVPWDVSAGVQGLVSSGEPSHPGRRGLIFSSSGLGCRWGSLESEPQDCLPRCRDALLSGVTPRSGVRHPICTPSLGTSRHAASSASTTVPLPPLAPSHSGPSL